MLNFLPGRCFSRPASHAASGSVPSWAWAQAEGRAGEGPLPFRQGGGAVVVPEPGGRGPLGCSPLTYLLLAKAWDPLSEPWPYRPLRQIPGARPSSAHTCFAWP